MELSSMLFLCLYEVRIRDLYLFFICNYLVLCAYLCMCGHTFVKVIFWSWRDNLWNLVHSFHHVGPRDWIWSWAWWQSSWLPAPLQACLADVYNCLPWALSKALQLMLGLNHVGWLLSALGNDRVVIFLIYTLWLSLLHVWSRHSTRAEARGPLCGSFLLFLLWVLGIDFRLARQVLFWAEPSLQPLHGL